MRLRQPFQSMIRGLWVWSTFSLLAITKSGYHDFNTNAPTPTLPTDVKDLWVLECDRSSIVNQDFDNAIRGNPLPSY